MCVLGRGGGLFSSDLSLILIEFGVWMWFVFCFELNWWSVLALFDEFWGCWIWVFEGICFWQLGSLIWLKFCVLVRFMF